LGLQRLAPAVAVLQNDLERSRDAADSRDMSRQIPRGGEEQLIVLTIVQRVFERRMTVTPRLDRIFMDGYGFYFDERADAALAADVSQVAGKPVGKVDHRGDAELRQIPRRLESRLEGQVPAEKASAQRPGDVDAVADFGAITTY